MLWNDQIENQIAFHIRYFCLKTFSTGCESVFQYITLLILKNLEIGRQLWPIVLSSVSNKGIAFANFKLVGKVPDDNDKLAINY